MRGRPRGSDRGQGPAECFSPRLAGRNNHVSRALITGASRGIGAAIARVLAAAGHTVILNYRSQDEQAEAVKAQITERGGKVVLARFDVRDREAAHAALERLLSDPEPIDVLVNNAGIARDNPLPSIPWEDWADVTRTT